MQTRREVWKKISEETKSFVFQYLKDNLKLKEADFENFLFPDYETNLLDSRGMHDMEKAVGRVISAMVAGEKICVYGDYDCDGVPGTALLRDFFSKINYQNVEYYIPHRHTEGYGLNVKAIKKLGSMGVKLLITIDLGTTNVEEVDFANSLSIDTIITDHHLPISSEDGEVLPKAYAILNNKKASCDYANKDLCGSGTVFKLVVEISRELRRIEEEEKVLSAKLEKQKIKTPKEGQEKWLLDLVAIATIADMVPLTHENRTLSIYGLHVLSKTPRVGIHTLFKNGKVDLSKVNETDIAFTVAPRINSASRMDHPKTALSLFSNDLSEGINAAHKLEKLNSERKDTTKSIMKKVYKILDERIQNSAEKKLPEIVVIGSSEWNVGVLGILASKILDKYNVNVFCFGRADERSLADFSYSEQAENMNIFSASKQTQTNEAIFKGSCRSRGDVHLVKLMTSVKEKFVHFGGHELAGGFSVNFKNLHDLEDELNRNIEVSRIPNLVLEKKENSKSFSVDINLEKINSDFLNALNLIGPYGVGNPKPIFKIQNIKDSKFERFGKNGEHLKIKLVGKDLQDKKVEREAIKFFVDEKEEQSILEKFSAGEIFYEVEPGWMSQIPRLKIII